MVSNSLYQNTEQLGLQIQTRSNAVQLLTDKQKQFVHDMRSPLTAIKICLTHLDGVPTEVRSLLVNSLSRITNMVNDMAQSDSIAKTGSTQKPLELLIQDVIKEKKITTPRAQMSFYSTIKQCTQAQYNSQYLTRILSNILNNAIEASVFDPCIEIRLIDTDQSVEIRIQDRGIGIPRDILPKIMSEGFTHNKSNGNGIGLYYAKKHITQWGGSLDIYSKEHTGTTVVLKLKK